jgi:hypothetical protein
LKDIVSPPANKKCPPVFCSRGAFGVQIARRERPFAKNQGRMP